jgi:hypothetical protein
MRSAGRLLTGSIGALPALAVHRLADPLDVLGRLAAGHAEPAHQRVGHLGGKPITNAGGATDMSIEDGVDLMLGESFGLENVDESLKSDLSARLVDDLDNLGAGWAGSANQPRSCSAINASHKAKIPTTHRRVAASATS